MEIEDKIKKAERLIASLAHGHNLALALSGGKDSVLVDWMAREANAKVQRFHNVTTIDPPQTLSFCLKHGCELVRGRYSFLDLVEKKGFPTMFRRFCCKELKERYYADFALFGIRRFESVKRAKCYDSYSDVYYYSKKKYTNRFFPIIDFTDEEVEYCINTYQIECHPSYYDQNGKFQVTHRLGCIGCPLQGDRGRADFVQYPKFLVHMLRRGILFHQRMGRTADDAALNLIYNLFYSNHKYKQYEQTYNGLFQTSAWIELEKYFGINKDMVLSHLPKPKF